MVQTPAQARAFALAEEVFCGVFLLEVLLRLCILGRQCAAGARASGVRGGLRLLYHLGVWLVFGENLREYFACLAECLQ